MPEKETDAVAETDASTTAETGAATQAGTQAEAHGGRGRRGRALARVRLVAPWVVAAALVAVGGYGWVQADALHSTPAAQNAALVDASGTAEVQSVVTQALTRVLSYDSAAPDATTAAADQVLAGSAREEYDTLYAALLDRAPGQELVLTARVQSVAVEQLEGDRAEALVFLDQTSQRATDAESTVAAAQVGVTLERSGSTWHITELSVL